MAAVCPGWGAAGGMAMTVPLPAGRPATAVPTPQPAPPPVSRPAPTDLEVSGDLVIGPVEAGVGIHDRPPIALAPGATAPALRVLLFANYGPPDGAVTGIMRWVEEQLAGRDDVADVGWYPSPLPTQREPAEVIADFASRYDAVVLGVGLSGSRSWKVAIDAVQLERLGIPTVTLVARGYEGYIFRLTGVAGLVDHPPVVLVDPQDPPKESGFDPALVEDLMARVRRR